MKEKFTKEEVQSMLENAEQKRNEHYAVMTKLKDAQEGCTEVSPEEQIHIIKRGRKDEIETLLELFSINSEVCPISSSNAKEPMCLCAEAQNLLYDSKDYKEALLTNTKLCWDVEKRLIDDGDTDYITNESLSAEAEVYLVKSVIVACNSTQHKLGSELELIASYIKQRTLSNVAEIHFMNFLTDVAGRDSVIDGAANLVCEYIKQHKSLCDVAQQKLVASGVSKAIVLYCEVSENNFTSQAAIRELLKRATKCEVEAYIKRYSEE